MAAQMVYPTAPADTQDVPTAQTGVAENVESPGKAKTLLSKVKQKAKKLKNTMKKVTGTGATSTAHGEVEGHHERDSNDIQPDPNGNDEDDGTGSNEAEEDEEDDGKKPDDKKLTYEELRSIGALDKEGDGSEAEVHAGVPFSSMSESPGTCWKGADDSTPISPYKSAGPSNALQATPTEYRNYAANVDPLLEGEKPIASKPYGLAEDISGGLEKENSPLGSASSEAKVSNTISSHEAEKPQNRYGISDTVSDNVPQPKDASKPDPASGNTSSPTYDGTNLMNENGPDGKRGVPPSEHYNGSVKQNLSEMSVPAVGRLSSPTHDETVLMNEDFSPDISRRISPSEECNDEGEQNLSEMSVPESSSIGVTSSSSYSQPADLERESSEQSVSELQAPEPKPEEVTSFSSYYSQSADPGRESGRPNVSEMSVSNSNAERAFSNSSYSEPSDPDEQIFSGLGVPEPEPGKVNVNRSYSLSASTGSDSGRSNLGETAVPESKAEGVTSRFYSQPENPESDGGKQGLSKLPVAESKPEVNLNSAYSKPGDLVFPEQHISNTGSNPGVSESKPEGAFGRDLSNPESLVEPKPPIESKPEGAFGTGLSNAESLVECKPSIEKSSIEKSSRGVAVMDEDLSADRKLGVGLPSSEEHVGSGEGNSLATSLPEMKLEEKSSNLQADVKYGALDTASTSDVDVSYPGDLIKPNPSFGKSSSPTHDKIAVMNEDLSPDRKLDVGLSSEEHNGSGKRSLLESSVPEFEELSGYQRCPSVRPESDELVYRPVSDVEVASRTSPGTNQCQDVPEKAPYPPVSGVNKVPSNSENDGSLAGARSCNDQKKIFDNTSEQPADGQVARVGNTDRETCGKFAADKSSTAEGATAGDLVGPDHRDENENHESTTGGRIDKVNTAVDVADNTDQEPNPQDDVVPKARVDDDVEKDEEEEYYDPNEVNDGQFQEGFRRGSADGEVLSGTLAGSAIEKLQGLKETMRSSFRYSSHDGGAGGGEETGLEGEGLLSPARHQQERGGFVQGLKETIASSLGYGKPASPSHEAVDKNDVSGREAQSKNDLAKMQQHSAETESQDGREEKIATTRDEGEAGNQPESDLAKMEQHSAETTRQDVGEEELPTPREEGAAGVQSDLAKVQQISAEITYQDGREEDLPTLRDEGEAGDQPESDLAKMQQHSTEITHQDGREEKLPTPCNEGEAGDQSESDLAKVQRHTGESTYQDGREEELPTPRDEGEAGDKHSDVKAEHDDSDATNDTSRQQYQDVREEEFTTPRDEGKVGDQHCHVKAEHDGSDATDDINRQHEASTQQRSGGVLQGVKDMFISKLGFNSNQPQETQI